MDLSRPENSVNSFINIVDYPLKFCGVDDAFRFLKDSGPGSWWQNKIQKTRSFWSLSDLQTGISWTINATKTFILISSSWLAAAPHYILCLFSEFVRWIVSYVSAYSILENMDDFLIVGPPNSNQRSDAKNVMQQVLSLMCTPCGGQTWRTLLKNGFSGSAP